MGPIDGLSQKSMGAIWSFPRSFPKINGCNCTHCTPLKLPLYWLSFEIYFEIIGEIKFPKNHAEVFWQNFHRFFSGKFRKMKIGIIPIRASNCQPETVLSLNIFFIVIKMQLIQILISISKNLLPTCKV